jgi:hypothetical protein
LASVVAVPALLAGRKSRREATAKDNYRDYLKLAFQCELAAEANKVRAAHGLAPASTV